jgi:hypothetical protein
MIGGEIVTLLTIRLMPLTSVMAGHRACSRHALVELSGPDAINQRDREALSRSRSTGRRPINSAGGENIASPINPAAATPHHRPPDSN